MAEAVLAHYYEAKLHEIVYERGWVIADEQKEELYERMRLCCANLRNNKERDLFLKLSTHYRYVGLDSYQPMFLALMEQVVKKYYQSNQKKIFLRPLKMAEETKPIKSSDVVAYLSQSVQMSYSDILGKKQFAILRSADLTSKKKQESFANSPLLLVDDYIGSGNYAAGVLQELFDKYGVSPERVVVCVLFITRTALKKLIALHCRGIEYCELVESILPQLSSEEKELLERIEVELEITENFRYGFLQSANLITLLRTPNNTLPIFWYKRKSGHAPFERK